jgi:hypothetical protein
MFHDMVRHSARVGKELDWQALQAQLGYLSLPQISIARTGITP